MIYCRNESLYPFTMSAKFYAIQKDIISQMQYDLYTGKRIDGVK